MGWVRVSAGPGKPPTSDGNEDCIHSAHRTNKKALGLSALVKGHSERFFADVLRVFNLAAEERASDAARVRARPGPRRLPTRSSCGEEAIVTESYRACCDLLRERRVAHRVRPA